jgi:hypothetical protein
LSRIEAPQRLFCSLRHPQLLEQGPACSRGSITNMSQHHVCPRAGNEYLLNGWDWSTISYQGEKYQGAILIEIYLNRFFFFLISVQLLTMFIWETFSNVLPLIFLCISWGILDSGNFHSSLWICPVKMPLLDSVHF